MRVMAVDYGDRRVGMAASDELGIAAHGLPTAEVRSPQQAVKAVVQKAQELQVERIIVGLPLNMDGSRGERAEATLVFCDLCREELDIPIETYDERWTTVRARNTLREAGLKARRQKKHVDKLAAVVLLQDYLTGASI